MQRQKSFFDRHLSRLRIQFVEPLQEYINKQNLQLKLSIEEDEHKSVIIKIEPICGNGKFTDDANQLFNYINCMCSDSKLALVKKDNTKFFIALTKTQLNNLTTVFMNKSRKVSYRSQRSRSRPHTLGGDEEVKVEPPEPDKNCCSCCFIL